MDADTYLETAKAYLYALEILTQNIDANSPKILNPVNLVASHALELALKSYLINKGRDESNLKDIGHNLSKALDEAKKEGFRIHFSHEYTVELLSYGHDVPFQNRYPQPGVPLYFTTFPALLADIRKVIEIAEEATNNP